MKVIITMLVVALASGCATYVIEPWSKPHRYYDGELSLRLDQRADSVLELELRNTTSHPITNAFPEGLFMGTFTLVQVGREPCEAYHKDYWNLVLHATLRTPDPRVIEPGGRIVYEVALEDLVVPFPKVKPTELNDIIFFATMRDFDLSSNALVLKQRERVTWGFVMRFANPDGL